MKVYLSYQEMKSSKIQTKLIKKAKPISILVPTEQLNYKQINLSLMPNLIHSLDASNVYLLVKIILQLNIANLHNLYTIHDCFASDYRSNSDSSTPCAASLLGPTLITPSS